MKDKLKYIIAMILLFCVSFVGGCVVADARTAEANTSTRIIRVSSDGNMKVYKDKVTGVHYLLYREFDTRYGSPYIAADMCVMVDAEGKPLVDKEK